MDKLLGRIGKMIEQLQEGMTRVEAQCDNWDITAYTISTFQIRIDLKDTHKTS